MPSSFVHFVFHLSIWAFTIFIISFLLSKLELAPFFFNPYGGTLIDVFPTFLLCYIIWGNAYFCDHHSGPHTRLHCQQVSCFQPPLSPNPFWLSKFRHPNCLGILSLLSHISFSILRKICSYCNYMFVYLQCDPPTGWRFERAQTLAVWLTSVSLALGALLDSLWTLENVGQWLNGWAGTLHPYARPLSCKWW